VKTRTQIRVEFQAEWDKARAIFPFMAATPIVDDIDPVNGADGFFPGIATDGPHFQFALAYAPPLGITWPHRYIHEIGHYVDALLRVFGMTKAYIRQRHWAWRFKGALQAAESWNAQERAATAWAELPVEMWAEAFVPAVMGYVEQERTVNWGLPFPTDAHAFFVGMMREVVPVTYPSPPGWTRLAKADDDSLFFYRRAIDNMILVLDGGFTMLGSIKKWWTP
jgi:hypothetical protein